MISLKAALDQLYLEFDRVDSAADPVHIVRRYPDPADREVVGFCAAALAFGRVASVLASVETLLAEMGPSPAGFVRGFDPARHRAAFRALGHRWTRGADLAALLWILRQMLDTAGSIEAFFLKGYEASAEDIGPTLDSFCERALRFDLDAAYGRRRPVRTVHYFFPKPSSGSGCKRLNLFLRWMVRRDRIDLGVWSRVSAAQLIVPLDTHVIRVGQCLGLTRYRSPSWKMAREITTSLRALDPADPVKYDFSLCHLGMLNVCGFRAPRRGSRVGDPARAPQRGCRVGDPARRPQGAANCPLRGLCGPDVDRRQSSRRSSARR